MNIKATFYNDSVVLQFNLMALQDFQFDAMINFISMNKEKGLIETRDLMKDEEDNITLLITGIENNKKLEFIKCLSAETLETILPRFVNEEYLKRYSLPE